jgi:hypothetical protein
MLTVLRSRLEETIRDETEVFDHVSQTEMFRRIDRAYRRVFNLLVQAFGQSYFRADPPAVINLVAGTRYYDLPADFFQAISVHLTVDGTVFPVSLLDPNNADLLLNSVGYTGRRLFFEVLGRQKTSAETAFKDQVSLLPIPTRPAVLTVEYVPHSASFETSGDVQYADPNGWTSDYIVAEVSAFCMRKRQQSQDDYITERNEVVRSIIDMRDARVRAPGRVRDVTSRRLRPEFDDCDEEHE